MKNTLLAAAAFAAAFDTSALEKPIFHLDFDGKAPSAAVSEGIQPVEGRGGSRAAYFGKGSRLEFPCKGNLVQERGTVAMWVKRGWGEKDLMPDGQHPFWGLFGQKFPPDGKSRLGTGQLQFWFWGRGLRADVSDFADSFSTSEVICDDNWHHYVFTWDGAEARIGIDGVLGPPCTRKAPGVKALSSKAANGGPFAREGVAFDTFRVGGRCFPDNDEGFPAEAAIDDFRIYPHPLTESEVRELFLETATPEEAASAKSLFHPDYAAIFAERPDNPYEGGDSLALKLVETVRLDREGVAALAKVDRFASAGGTLEFGSLDGRDYCEAGTNANARFAVRFALDPAAPLHVVEIDYPDDRERTMDFVIQESQQEVWDGTTGADYTMQVGVMTGGHFPVSNHIQTHRCLYWTRPSGDVTLSALTARRGAPAAISEIRIYKVEDAKLPPLKVKTPAPNADGWRRHFALYFEDPAIGYDFSVKGDGFDADGLSDLIDRTAATMKYTGEDMLCYPGVWYFGPIAYGGYNPRIHAPDYLEAWYTKFDKEGLGFMPTINIFEMPFPHTPSVDALTDGSLHQTPLSILDNGSIQTNGLWGKPPDFNIAHGDVQSYLSGVVEALLAQGAGHPSFKGICLHISRHSFVTFGCAEAGYNDYCVERFCRETGNACPVDRADPLRGKAYAKWLRSDPALWEKWLDWRCSVVAGFWGGIANRLREARPDLKLMVNMFSASGLRSRPDIASPGALAAENRECGVDTAMLTAAAPNVIVSQSVAPADGRWQHPSYFPAERREASMAKMNNYFRQKETYTLLDGADFPWVGQHDRYWENDVGNPERKRGAGSLSRPWLKECKWRVTAINPGGRNALAHFALPLKWHDVLGMGKGGYLIGTYGMEGPLREFMAEFRALPAVKFETLPSPHPDVTFRRGRFDGRDWWYLLNTSDTPVAVCPDLPEGVRRLCGGDPWHGGELNLKPYQLIGFGN